MTKGITLITRKETNILLMGLQVPNPHSRPKGNTLSPKQAFNMIAYRIENVTKKTCERGVNCNSFPFDGRCVQPLKMHANTQCGRAMN